MWLYAQDNLKEKSSQNVNCGYHNVDRFQVILTSVIFFIISYTGPVSFLNSGGERYFNVRN